MSADPLLQPFQLKHLTLKNRLMTSSHEPAYPEDGLPKERYRAYHVERAKGGLALTMTAGSAIVSRDSPAAFNNVTAWKDEVVPWMKALSDACHDHGCAVMIQLTHLGWRTRWDTGDWLPTLAPGPAREPAHRAFPKVMEDFDFARVIRDYADAAERMQQAGLDGIELEAYGHLLDAFWSGHLNHLDAPYGGDLAARMRFPAEVLQAIRDRTGPNFLVGIRFTADDQQPGGISEDDGLTIAKTLRDRGLVDFLNVIRGRIDTDAALTDVIPVQGMRSAPHLDFAGRIRAEVGLPTFHAAKIQDVATARHAVSEGLLDMVGMTRAHMADPHIVNKIASGQEHSIRPCVGATYCLDRIYAGGAALCIHNPSTGRELSQPHAIAAAETAKQVVVVGAGPAGLEAARVAAARGHAVTVFEVADQPGGQVRLAAQDKRRSELLGIIDWRTERCTEAGVQFRFNTWAEAEDITALSPDLVIIATGGLPSTDLAGPGGHLALSPWDVLSGEARPEGRILVYDEAGDHAGIQTAEILATRGAEVELMSPDRTVVPEVMGMNLTPYMRSLQGHRVTFTIARRLLALVRAGNGLTARIGTDYSALTEERRFDHVVVNNGTRPLDELYFELKPMSRNGGEIDQQALIDGRAPFPAHRPEAGFDLARIGDAVASRNIHAAIYDALRLTRLA
ncbi:NADH:flavin oxidoreductase [Pseudooceanicola sp. CBS1P-1]|uniref:NAD(P)-binding protein n=1 Tax=Pseudooceanicola albus TaxID=2692189 RepID=A0A6L7G9A1_9RHOB|nr:MULTISPECIES: NADH:flavin oxidoreductase [Pseudooceanicola]MBT9383085.1 NADH:flavin oxidoreductase [Pseudooceanicola endophyticus]MXN19273.1 NAD(P)-binding protein [Pseudooceanicola albus]